MANQMRAWPYCPTMIEEIIPVMAPSMHAPSRVQCRAVSAGVSEIEAFERVDDGQAPWRSPMTDRHGTIPVSTAATAM